MGLHSAGRVELGAAADVATGVDGGCRGFVVDGGVWGSKRETAASSGTGVASICAAGAGSGAERERTIAVPVGEKATRSMIADMDWRLAAPVNMGYCWSCGGCFWFGVESDVVDGAWNDGAALSPPEVTNDETVGGAAAVH